jgi:hypothetical protein
MKPSRVKLPATRTIVKKAREVLNFAEVFTKGARYNSELLNALFGTDGIVPSKFATAEERRAFRKTREYARIADLIGGLPSGPLLDETYEIHLPSGRLGKRSGAKSA